MAVTQDLVEKQKISRDYGALIVGDQNGAAVVSKSPAEKAGLKDHDIILELNGQKIDAEHTLGSLIQQHQVGDEVALKIFRDGKEFDVKVKLEERK